MTQLFVFSQASLFSRIWIDYLTHCLAPNEANVWYSPSIINSWSVHSTTAGDILTLCVCVCVCVCVDVSLSSDFIAGFCGETEADHQMTVDLISRVGYNFVYCFPYSMRQVSFTVPITSFSGHLKTVLFLFREAAAFVTVWFLCAVYKYSYLLTYLLTIDRCAVEYWWVTGKHCCLISAFHCQLGSTTFLYTVFYK